jgi:hypothetical protein
MELMWLNGINGINLWKKTGINMELINVVFHGGINHDVAA